MSGGRHWMIAKTNDLQKNRSKNHVAKKYKKMSGIWHIKTLTQVNSHRHSLFCLLLFIVWSLNHTGQFYTGNHFQAYSQKSSLEQVSKSRSLVLSLSWNLNDKNSFLRWLPMHEVNRVINLLFLEIWSCDVNKLRAHVVHFTCFLLMTWISNISTPNFQVSKNYILFCQ